jgi:hypothetical protein
VRPLISLMSSFVILLPSLHQAETFETFPTVEFEG